MDDVPQEVWNQVATEAPALTAWGRSFLTMDGEEIGGAIARVRAALEASGYPPIVARAHVLVYPLLVERRAVEAFSRRHPEWAPFLPTVETPEEAIELARKELSLSPSEQTALWTSLPPYGPTRREQGDAVRLAWGRALSPPS